jgi:invasion protein IalB
VPGVSQQAIKHPAGIRIAGVISARVTQIGKIPIGGAGFPAMGVLLPSGLGLKIDQVDIGRVGFVRCQPNGCVAEVVMDDNLLEQLRAGQTATFIIFQTPEEGIGFPISLKGFGEGYDQLP